MALKGAKTTRWQRLGAVVLVLMVLSGAGSVGHVYSTYWTRVHRLPVLVTRLVRHHGGRMVSLADVSPWFMRALIATEDRTFYTNLGVSVRGILRALWADAETGRVIQGGSTLTQELVRDRMLTPRRTVRRKLTEALLSILVTMLYSKREILTLYVNQVYLGAGAYGVWAASRRYFGETPRELTLAQAALLAGLPQAPSAYDPLRHLGAARRRQWEVLTGMVNDGMISAQRARSAYGEPLGLNS